MLGTCDHIKEVTKKSVCVCVEREREIAGGDGKSYFFLQTRRRLGKLATSGAGVERPGFGTVGLGHVTSLSSSATKGRMKSNMYHSRSALSPRGGTISGNSIASGDHGSFLNRLTCTSGESECSLVKTIPG